jgi:hypothetical protein
MQQPDPAPFSHNPTAPSDPYDPKALGLPMPPPRTNNGTTTSNSYQNIYSTSGFDLIGILARVVNRKNPTIEIGAVDMSCSFVVVDAKKFDQPIVYASETFGKLTGYSAEEIVGRNCAYWPAFPFLWYSYRLSSFVQAASCKHPATSRSSRARSDGTRTATPRITSASTSSAARRRKSR